MDNSSFSSHDRSSSGIAASGGRDASAASATYSSPSGSIGSKGSSFDAREKVEQVQQAAHSTVDRLASTARNWADKVDERTRGMSELPTRAWDYSRSTVQEHPLQTIALSVLLGYVIGRFSGARNGHRFDQ